jgi:DNA-binding FrmR family transcriptional regulator
MAHVFDDKKMIISRIHRIKGQLEAIERSLDEESDCFSVLQTLSACRGGMNGLMGELIEGHVKEHVMQNPNSPKSAQDKAALSLVKLLKTYWK